MVALGRKYDTGIFLSPTKETCFLYLYTCYLDEDYVPRFARNFVLYYTFTHWLSFPVWQESTWAVISRKTQTTNVTISPSGKYK